MAKELFLEIGTEEIPAGFLPKAMADLRSLITKEFETARIGFGEIVTHATPRRMILAVRALEEEQPTVETTAMGPARSIAFDAQGNPTKAGIGFARGQGVDPAALKIVSTDKGEYVCAEKREEGRPTAELLKEMLPRLIGAIPFRKSMRWKDLDTRFARPVHWIVALFGGEVVPFVFGDVASSDRSRGHRFMAPAEFTVTGLEQYVAAAEAQKVIVDPARRKAIISEQVAAIAKREGGDVNVDEKLLDEVTYLVEYPVAICGSFEEKYLQLPKELLITSMREHQRYFVMYGADGKLMNRFITVSNTDAKDLNVVVRGNERVLRARLSDAIFFWQEDQKTPLIDRLESLKNVVYQQKLGTSYEKVERFRKLAGGLAADLDPAIAPLVDRAALLAKCDLETGMVYEFPELQGVMGREYATIEGEDARVAKAIFEHYLPVEAGGDLPSDNVGALVSLADKIDTLCGCFGVGLIPTGSADPYALRRNALGIIAILMERGFRLSLPALIGKAVTLLEPKLTAPAAEVTEKVVEFVRGRFLNLLTGQGFPADVVEAVLSARFDDVIDARSRVEALSALKGAEGFTEIATAFKRAVNIIKGGTDTPIDAALFVEPCEGALAEQISATKTKVAACVASADYASALKEIAGLRPAVDAFFDGVMVMDKDAQVKENRLALLTAVARLFEGIAEFGKIAA